MMSMKIKILASLCHFGLAATVPRACSSVDPSIRGDCGATAGDTRGIVTKDGCLNAGCCWDTSHDGVPWCYYAEHSTDKNIAAEQNNGDIEIILEASPIKENVPNQSLFGQPNVLKNEPIQAPTHKIGHPTTSPLSSIFPSSNAPKRKQSALAKKYERGLQK